MPAAARFCVPTGHCAGAYDGVVISTDLEPDDAIALLAMAPRLRGVPLLVILGEGNVDKREMAAAMLASFALDKSATIVQGRCSKASWPEAGAACYNKAGQRHSATVTTSDDEASVAFLLEAFLRKCVSPFALLLKPPHEFVRMPIALLKRTVGALYGSFNLSELRAALREASPGLTERACHMQQQGLLLSFKALLWVERAASIGQNGVLASTTTPAVWPLLEVHEGLMQHVSCWNRDMLNSAAKGLASVSADMAAAFGGHASTAAAFGYQQCNKVEAILEKAEKRVQIMLSIARSQGMQVCHADTLVAACLMDDAGVLSSFTRRCAPGHDANLKPTFNADATSSVAALLAEPGRSRQTLFDESVAILVASLGGEDTANSSKSMYNAALPLFAFAGLLGLIVGCSMGKARR